MKQRGPRTGGICVSSEDSTCTAGHRARPRQPLGFCSSATAGGLRQLPVGDRNPQASIRFSANGWKVGEDASESYFDPDACEVAIRVGDKLEFGLFRPVRELEEVGAQAASAKRSAGSRRFSAASPLSPASLLLRSGRPECHVSEDVTH